MSFLYKVSTTSARVARVAPRIQTASRAPFSISAPTAKSALDPVKDALKAVDRTVSDAAVRGIETGGRISPYFATRSITIYRPPSVSKLPICMHAASQARDPSTHSLEDAKPSIQTQNK